MIWENVELFNIDHVVQAEGGGLRLCRIPEPVRLGLNDLAQLTAYNGCGCEVRFNMRGDKAVVRLRVEFRNSITQCAMAEVYHGSFQGPYQTFTQFVTTEPSEIVILKPDQMAFMKQLAAERGMPYDPELVRVILPYGNPSILLGINGEVEPPRKEQAPSRKLLVYGSSITHGGNSLAGTASYAMRLTRWLKFDLINLGFAGSAFLEEAMADHIAGREDWEIAVFEFGINMIATWEVEAFARRVDEFLSRVTERHPDKWIFVIDMFRFARDLEDFPKAAAYREIVKNKADSLNRWRVVHLSGLELLEDAALLSADMVHPSPFGMEAIAEKLKEAIGKHIGL